MISAAKPPLSPTCSIGPHERSEPAHHLRASLVNIVATEPRGSCGEDCVPNFGRGLVLDAKLSEFELTLPDPMDEFDAGNRRCGSAEILEAEHRTKPQFDRSVILFDQIVQIF